MDTVNLTPSKTPPRVRQGFLALHLFTIALAYLAYNRTDACTWKMGGASWELTYAHWARTDRETDPAKVTDLDTSDEALARLRERMLDWLYRQRAWARASYAVAGVSVFLLAVRRDVASAAACVICLCLALGSADLMHIRF